MLRSFLSRTCYPVAHRAMSTTTAKHILDRLGGKKRSIQAELARSVKRRNSINLADIIMANVHAIPEDPSVYNISVLDYNTNQSIEVELPSVAEGQSNSWSAGGGRKGAIAFADSLYSEGKKGKRGEIVLTGLLKKIEAAEGIVAKVYQGVEKDDELAAVDKANIEQAVRGMVSVKWPKKGGSAATDDESRANSKKEERPARPYGNRFRSFAFPLGSATPTHIILAGRNSRENEELTLKVAKSGDVWMHARGSPGSHVVVKSMFNRPYKDRSEEGDWNNGVLQCAANLAAFYSKHGKDGKTEITLADPKYIAKPPGAPVGTVWLRTELKSLVGNPFDAPEECIAARQAEAAHQDAPPKKRLKRSP